MLLQLDRLERGGPLPTLLSLPRISFRQISNVSAFSPQIDFPTSVDSGIEAFAGKAAVAVREVKADQIHTHGFRTDQQRKKDSASGSFSSLAFSCRDNPFPSYPEYPDFSTEPLGRLLRVDGFQRINQRFRCLRTGLSGIQFS